MLMQQRVKRRTLLDKKKVWIAFGGNIGDTAKYISDALFQMEKAGIEIVKKSSLIQTKPYGKTDQADFVNGACLCLTTKSKHELLDCLLGIEKSLDRVREIKWGPRTIDLDILYYEDEVFEGDRLILPHPEIQKRSFVLEPLNEISPEKLHPVLNKTAGEMLGELELADYLDWLESRERFGIKLGLDNTYALLQELDNPHKKVRCIHVAGTNGKGSLCTYLSSVLKEAGYKVGLFTSPFIETFRERFQINNQNIPEKKLLEIVKQTKAVVDKLESTGLYPTYFEIVTAMCFDYFARSKVDFAVMEVGLGGLYDSTNVIENPVLSFITTIDYDHTDYLGDTLEEIAYQKAGIIKENSSVFCYPNQKNVLEVIEKVALSKNAVFSILDADDVKVTSNSITGVTFDYKKYKDVNLSMWGRHQGYNASLAIKGLDYLKENNIVKFTEKQLYDGLKKAKIIARLEVLNEKEVFIIDGAHNLQGANALKNALNDLEYDKLILGLGILKDKDYKGVIKLLAPLADEVVCTALDMPRALTVEELVQEVSKVNKNVTGEKDLKLAVQKSMKLAGSNSVVLWGGSLYLIGEIRKIYNK